MKWPLLSLITLTNFLLSRGIASETNLLQINWYLERISNNSEVISELATILLFSGLLSCKDHFDLAAYDETRRGIQEHIQYQVEFIQKELLLQGL